MQAIIQAVVARINTSGDLAQLSGAIPQVFITQAPENTALPLFVISSLADRAAHSFAGDACHTVDLSLLLVADAMPLALADALAKLFDGATFALASGTLLLCELISSGPVELAAHNSQNQEVYQARIAIRCVVYQPPGS